MIISHPTCPDFMCQTARALPEPRVRIKVCERIEWNSQYRFSVELGKRKIFVCMLQCHGRKYSGFHLFTFFPLIFSTFFYHA